MLSLRLYGVVYGDFSDPAVSMPFPVSNQRENWVVNGLRQKTRQYSYSIIYSCGQEHIQIKVYNFLFNVQLSVSEQYIFNIPHTFKAFLPNLKTHMFAL